MSNSSKEFTMEDWEKWNQCASYPYCGKEALSEGKTFLWSLIFIFGCGMIGLIVDLVTDGEKVVYWLYWGLGIGLIMMFVLVIYNRQHLVMKALKQFFRDEEGVFWSVALTGAASVVISNLPDRKMKEAIIQRGRLLSNEQREAKSSRSAYIYVKRAKNGIKDWNWFDGGPAKVRCFNGLKLVKEGSKRSQYTYFNKKGKVKKITITNEYEGLIQATSR